jgi:hypothetical protein
LSAPVSLFTENSSRKTAAEGDENMLEQRLCACERVVHVTPETPRLEQLVNNKAFAQAFEPTLLTHLVASVPKQSVPQQISAQYGAGFVTDGTEPEQPR